MLIGVNLISPHTLPLIQRLYAEGLIDFCELMVDNVIHLDPLPLSQTLDMPVALHIVSSRFLEKSFSELQTLSARLSSWIKALAPLYVSDHLITFTKKGQWCLLTEEWDYVQHAAHIKNRAQMWQGLLGCQIFFENHASLYAAGKAQKNFFSNLIEETAAGLLFDFSNAFIADYNKVLAKEHWHDLMVNTPHYHVGGFRLDADTGLAIDTHDEAIHPAVFAWMRAVRTAIVKPQGTVVVEFDANVTEVQVRAALEGIKEVLLDVV